MDMNFVVMASGKGTTVEFLLSKQFNGQLQPKICGLITDNSRAEAPQVAQRYEIPHQCISPKDYSSYDLWDSAILAGIESYQPDVILLAGFLKKIGPRVLNKFHNKIINCHPSLLPKFGGLGMYGRNVHASVLESKETKTGVTIHYVNEQLDDGQILKQVEVPVQPADTVEILEDRVKAAERLALLEFLNSWEMQSPR